MNTSTKKKRPTDGQPEMFKSLARELGCDESETNFDKALGNVASAPPEKPSRKSKKIRLKS